MIKENFLISRIHSENNEFMIDNSSVATISIEETVEKTYFKEIKRIAGDLIKFYFLKKDYK